MKKRFIIGEVVIGILMLVSYAFSVSFCGYYTKTQSGWLYSSVISIFLDLVIIENFLFLVITIIWYNAEKNEKMT